jgi:hypothetical protein
MNTTTESERNASAPEVSQSKTKRAQPTRKGARAKKPGGKPKADRTNKKTEVIAMLKRDKGATLAEIMKRPNGRHTRSAA